MDHHSGDMTHHPETSTMGHMHTTGGHEHTTGGHMHGTTMDMGHGMDHGMKMYFNTDYSNLYVLFKSWHVENVSQLIGSFIGIFLMAVLYEGIKYYRDHLFRSASMNIGSISLPRQGNVLMETTKSEYDDIRIATVKNRILSGMHFYQTLLHMVQIIVSYFLMLVFMTYNLYLCIAVVLGAGFGHFIFGWKKHIVVDITEHCH